MNNVTKFVSTPSTHAYRMAVKAASIARYHAKVKSGEIVTEAARVAKQVADAGAAGRLPYVPSRGSVL